MFDQGADGSEPAETARGIQSIERATALLEIIAQEGGAARLQVIASHAGLRKSTTHNILATLVKLGYARRSETDAKYYLGERIMNLARILGNDHSLRQRLRPALEAISIRSGETVFLAVPSGDQIFYIDGIDADDPDHGCSRIGARRPLEGSAIGLVFLAFIPELRQRVLSIRPEAFSLEIDAEIQRIQTRGFALDIPSPPTMINCVAVPVFEAGRVRASFVLRGPSDRLAEGTLNEMAWMMIRQVGKYQPRHESPVWWPLPESS